MLTCPLTPYWSAARPCQTVQQLSAPAYTGQVSSLSKGAVSRDYEFKNFIQNVTASLSVDIVLPTVLHI